MRNLKDVWVTPDSKYIVAVISRNIFVWSFDEEKLVHVFEEERESDDLIAVISTPDSSQLITASNNHIISFWDLSNSEFVQKINIPAQNKKAKTINLRITANGTRMFYSREGKMTLNYFLLGLPSSYDIYSEG